MANNHRIDNRGMEALMNDYKTKQGVYFDNYDYLVRDDLLNDYVYLPIHDLLDTAYAVELLLMPQLW